MWELVIHQDRMTSVLWSVPEIHLPFPPVAGSVFFEWKRNPCKINVEPQI